MDGMGCFQSFALHQARVSTHPEPTLPNLNPFGGQEGMPKIRTHRQPLPNMGDEKHRHPLYAT